MIGKKTKKYATLKRKLEYHYKYFDASKISPDPLEFPHKFSHPYDIEASAFISSVFAYGNVKQIIQTLNQLHEQMGESPYQFLLNFDRKNLSQTFYEIKHRFYTNDDIITLFEILSKVYNNYGTLGYYFLMYHFNKALNLKDSISFFSQNLLSLSSKTPTSGVKFMFPDPYKGSACKRMNMFLRWMIRKDELDFGIWEEISPNKLVIPIDTHIEKICKNLGLTKRTTANWKMAEEITENLKLFDANDPVKYDFAICHIGMRKMKF